jgi:copper/silver efflux system protein
MNTRIEQANGDGDGKRLDHLPPRQDSFIGGVIRFCLEQKLVVLLMVLAAVGVGVAAAPFDWQLPWWPRSPVAVDAIPDTGENQQIVFTEWPGRSAQDVQDQVTFPLTSSLLGVPGVKTIRSTSMFGFSSIFVIFDEGVEFYWSRTRLLEKLNSLPAGTLPEGVQAALGPDATALGQVFWYTLEGRDPRGNPIGGWDLHELRSLQDWTVRYALLAAEGVSEVASIGGFVREYQVDVDPDAMRAHNVTLDEVFNAVRMSNLDVGARTIEINRVEYIIRGLGFIRELADIEQTVVRLGEQHIPIRIQDVAHVALGPAERRGALDVAGAEAVGGVVTVRYGYNPLEAIQNVKAKIRTASTGLPARAIVDWQQANPQRVEDFARVQGFNAFAEDGLTLNHDEWVPWLRARDPSGWPQWVNLSQLTIVPFYDRTGLIYETLGTLNKALFEQILITVIVVIVMLMHLRSSMLISTMLPLAVLICFIAMRFFGVDANVVALAGIAIAIGTIVDMGIILSENILKHLEEADPNENRIDVIHRAATEVGSAVVTAILTTVVSFLPVFTMIGAEGKLFRPLAFTKTFVLLASVIVALTIIPSAAHLLLARSRRVTTTTLRKVMLFSLLALGVILFIAGLFTAGFVAVLLWMAGLILVALAGYQLIAPMIPAEVKRYGFYITNVIAVLAVGYLLARNWMPLGLEIGLLRNFIFVFVLIALLLGLFRLVLWAYGPILRFCLDYKAVFLPIPVLLIVFGATVWLGFERIFGFIPTTASHIGIDEQRIRLSSPWVWATHEFPPLGREFMPPLDEGSFLFMPTVMPHASIGEALEIMQLQDAAIAEIPEVETVVGKLGRAESPLDPAPVSMFETVIIYKTEYISDTSGRPIRFQYDHDAGQFVRDEHGELIPDSRGRPYRNWRDHIRSPRDIWDEIDRVARVPGATGASMAGPIEIRRVMLQSGITAPMAVRVQGPDLETIERASLRIEQLMREGIPGVNTASVRALRSGGKPYLLIRPDREAIGRYGLRMEDVQKVIEVAIGGREITTTVEGRERYPVRVRYPRELRDSIDDLQRILVPTMDGAQIPLGQVATVEYEAGPTEIKTEDTFLVNYVMFGPTPGFAEVDVVENVDRFLNDRIARGQLLIPPGVSFSYAGTYENQLRAQRTLMIVLPVSLFIIFMILYLNFRSVSTTLIIFSGIAVAWAGGFTMIWFYGQPWFGNFEIFGVNMRDAFQLRAINLSVAVWVGFLALFGIATDDGVLIATYLRQSFARRRPDSIEQVRRATVEAGLRRARPALMTTATTLLALLPVLTSTGRGADIMIPMAIPTVGGMTLAILTMFTVPVLCCWVEELRLRMGQAQPVPEPRAETELATR